MAALPAGRPPVEVDASEGQPPLPPQPHDGCSPAPLSRSSPLQVELTVPADAGLQVCFNAAVHLVSLDGRQTTVDSSLAPSGGGGPLRSSQEPSESDGTTPAGSEGATFGTAPPAMSVGSRTRPILKALEFGNLAGDSPESTVDSSPHRSPSKPTQKGAKELPAMQKVTSSSSDVPRRHASQPSIRGNIQGRMKKTPLMMFSENSELTPRLASLTSRSQRNMVTPPESLASPRSAYSARSLDLQPGNRVLYGDPVGGVQEGIIISEAEAGSWRVRPAHASNSESDELLRAADLVKADSAGMVGEPWSCMTRSQTRDNMRSFESGAFNRTEFIRVDETHVSAGNRTWLRRLMETQLFDSIVAGVVLVNLVLSCEDSDARAVYPGKHASEEPPAYVFWGMLVCFCFFCFEFIVRLIVERPALYIRKWSNVVDVLIIASGLVEYLLKSRGGKGMDFSLLRLARIFRLMRLMRIFRLVSGFGELRRLAQMMGGCFKTLLWSFALLLLVMTMWSVVAVELINPAIQELAEKGEWDSCPRCKRAFSSVFMANLTFFQTVVAGDSWGLLAVPVIEACPALALVFTGALMTLVFGVLNLIVAVIVDTFAESRAKDVNQMAGDIDAEEEADKKSLQQIFDKVDVNGDGALSFEELFEGARRVADFARWLRVLDVDNGDLLELFKMVDEDGSGEIAPSEFVNAMYRMKHAESKTATKIIKHMVVQMDRKSDAAIEEFVGRMHRMELLMSRRFTNQEKTLQNVVDTNNLSARHEELQERLREQEELFQERLARQEEAIKQMLADVLGKTRTEALDAAQAKVDELMDNVRQSGREFTRSMARTVSVRLDDRIADLAAIVYNEPSTSDPCRSGEPSQIDEPAKTPSRKTTGPAVCAPPSVPPRAGCPQSPEDDDVLWPSRNVV